MRNGCLLSTGKPQRRPRLLQPREQELRQQAERQQLLREPALQRHDAARMQPARAGPDFRPGHAALFRPLPDDVIVGPGASAELRLVPIQAADHVLTGRITNDVTMFKNSLKGRLF